MARTLKRTVLLGGQIFPAGTAETPELSKALPKDASWSGAKKSADEAPKKAPAKAPSAE